MSPFRISFAIVACLILSSAARANVMTFDSAGGPGVFGTDYGDCRGSVCATTYAQDGIIAYSVFAPIDTLFVPSAFGGLGLEFGGNYNGPYGPEYALYFALVGGGAGDAGFLRLVADIYFYQQARCFFFFADGVGDGVGEFGAIEGMDEIADAHGFPRFVGLQAADKVEHEPGMAGSEGREFSGGILDAVFAEMELAGGERGLHGFDRVGLGNRHQGDILGAAAGADSGGGDAVEHGTERAGDVGVAG